MSSERSCSLFAKCLKIQFLRFTYHNWTFITGVIMLILLVCLSYEMQEKEMCGYLTDKVLLIPPLSGVERSRAGRVQGSRLRMIRPARQARAINRGATTSKNLHKTIEDLKIFWTRLTSCKMCINIRVHWSWFPFCQFPYCTQCTRWY